MTNTPDTSENTSLKSPSPLGEGDLGGEVKYHPLFILLLILFLAALVRFWGITEQSFWIDEGFTWNLTQYHDPFLILKNDVHPPLYFLMIDVWVNFTGTSEFAMRLFSLLPSLLSVAIIYQLAREIIINRKTVGTSNGVSAMRYLIPIFAALFMAIAEPETNLSQEARSYTWHVLWACLSMWSFLRWDRTSQRFWFFLWVLSTIALIYTFYLGAFVGVAQGLYALIFWRGKKRIIAIGGLIFAAISLMPWLLLTGGEQSQNISRGEVILPKDYLFWLLDFRKGYFTGQWALMIGLFLLGLVYFEHERIRLHETAILLLLWFGIPLLLTLIMNSFVPTYQPRRVSQIVPAITLLAAFGLGNIRGKVGLFLAAIITVYGVFSLDFWRFKQDWRRMAAETSEYIAPDTPILFELAGDDYAPRYHYERILSNSHDFLLDEGTAPPEANVLLGLTTWRHLDSAAYEGGLPAIIDSLDHLWLFYWSSDEGALYWLEQFGFERTADLTFDYLPPDVFFYRYDRLPEDVLMQYENGLILHNALIHDNFSVELFWSTEEQLEKDYTISLVLLDESGQIVAQSDSQPFFNMRPTSSWQVDELVYDLKHLNLSQELDTELYQFGVVVYYHEGGEIIRLNALSGTNLLRLNQ